MAKNKAQPAPPATVDELIKRIKGKEEGVWVGAGPLGAAAIKPLAAVMTDKDYEVARSARRAMWKIVRHAGRPGATDEKTAVSGALVPLCSGDHPPAVLREVMWMLSEVGCCACVGPVAGLLKNETLREDARMVLQRLPGEKSLAALKKALASASDDFKPSIAQSLRARGVDVSGIACRKMKPVKQTKVKPMGR